MRIVLKNVGKISTADVEIKGITVIGGENNSGKSTVGKTLFSLFNLYYNHEKRIMESKERNIRRLLNRVIQDIDSLEDISIGKKQLFHKNVTPLLLNGVKDQSEIVSIINCAWSKISNDDDLLIDSNRLENNTALRRDLERVYEVSIITKNQLFNQNLSARLSAEFGMIPKNFYCTNEESSVDLIIKTDTISASLETERVIVTGEIELHTEAIYIDDASILDSILPPFGLNISGVSHKDHLAQKFFMPSKSNDDVADVLAINGIKRVIEKVDLVCPGKIDISNSEVFYQSKPGVPPVQSIGLSEGLKLFIILKSLLLNRAIEENGTLILDEPEIHVHPEWQLVLAELIVVLQKEFGLHFLITTHSPYFLEAIEVFSQKYDIAEDCRYYLAENVGDNAVIKDVTNDTEQIYQKLVKPFQELENMRKWND